MPVRLAMATGICESQAPTSNAFRSHGATEPTGLAELASKPGLSWDSTNRTNEACVHDQLVRNLHRDGANLFRSPVADVRMSNWFRTAAADLDASILRRDLWIHQGLIDVFRRYRRTVLGPLWHTLNLGALIFLLGFVWSAIFKMDAKAYFLTVTPTLIIWTFISSTIVEGCGTFIAAQSTALSIRFPYTAFVFAHLWRLLLICGHHLILLVPVYILVGFLPDATILLAIPAFLLILINGFWISLLLSILTLRARDTQMVVASGMQIAMFATPVFWPRELLGPGLAALVDYNPFYHLLLIGRDPFIGRVPPIESWLWSAGMGSIGLLVSLFVFGKVRKRLAYWY